MSNRIKFVNWIKSFFQTVSVSVSILTLTFISIDRWYAICFPLKFKSTTGRAKTAIIVIWVVALLFGKCFLRGKIFLQVWKIMQNFFSLPRRSSRFDGAPNGTSKAQSWHDILHPMRTVLESTKWGDIHHRQVDTLVHCTTPLHEHRVLANCTRTMAEWHPRTYMWVDPYMYELRDPNCLTRHVQTDRLRVEREELDANEK